MLENEITNDSAPAASEGQRMAYGQTYVCKTCGAEIDDVRVSLFAKNGEPWRAIVYRCKSGHEHAEQTPISRRQAPVSRRAAIVMPTAQQTSVIQRSRG